MRVLVYEAAYQGHALTYLRLMLPAIRELVDDVVVAVHEQAPESEEFRLQLAPLSGQVKIEPCIRVNPMNASGVADSLIESIRRFGAQHVYVPRADGAAQIFGLRRAMGRNALPADIPIEILLLGAVFVYPHENLRSKLKSMASFQAVKLSRWTRLHHIDPIAYAAIKAVGGPLADCCRLMPDPVEFPQVRDHLSARRLLGLPEDGRYIGFAGIGDRRKGVELLMRAFARAKLAATDRLLIMGRLSDDIQSFADTEEFAVLQRQKRLLVFNRYMTDEELQAGISAMNVVCTPYPRQTGSASFVIRAAAAQRPVLTANFGWMEYIVPLFNLGRTCNVRDIDGFAGHIARALDESLEYKPSEAAANFVRYHSVSNFQAAWTTHLRQRLGLPPSQASVSWESVVPGGDAAIIDSSRLAGG